MSRRFPFIVHEDDAHNHDGDARNAPDVEWLKRRIEPAECID